MSAAALLVMTLSSVLPAQQDYRKHNVNLGVGAGLPQADLSRFFDPKFGLDIAYGYRFHRNFQADFGFDTVFGAANVKYFLPTQVGYLKVQDYQYFIPMGGRVILPLASGRLMLFGGGGGAHMRYSEHLSQPDSYYRVACPTCSSRSGWGYYATAGFTLFVDRYRHFRLGFAPKVYRGNTEGQPVGAVPGIRTRDHWILSLAEFGISF
ncbi:MAG: hypothetical protein HY235_04640 [Acidobacteria bacterium]|nr:hypothetical protein [Acidobacteriota bacterium]